MNTKHPSGHITKFCALFAIATVVLALIMMTVFPTKASLPEGFFTPIIAFEFAQQISHIPYLTDSKLDAESNRAAMRAGLLWDTVFPFAYAGFLFLLLLSIKRPVHNSMLSRLGLLLAALIVPLDLYENHYLSLILDAAESSSLDQALFTGLLFATWAKWGVIALVLAILSWAFLRSGARINALVCSVPVVLTLYCLLIDAQPLMLEIMALSVSVCFFILIVRQLWNWFRPGSVE